MDKVLRNSTSRRCIQTCPTMNKHILKFALAVLLLPLFGSPAVAEERNAPKVFVQFLPEKGGGYADTFLTTELRQADSLPAGAYHAKAKVTLATERGPEVVDSRALEWRAHPHRAVDASGWLEKSGAWIWIPGTKSAPLDLPFDAARNVDDRDVNLTDFDELWLDFVEMVPGESCHISVAMNVAAKSRKTREKESGIRKYRLVSGPSKMLSPILSIDSASANWKPRDNFYLAERVLGLKFDEDWRYLKSGKNTVIQRRFHQDLRNVEALDLLFAPGVAVGRINILVSWKDHLRPDEIVDWDAMPKQIEPTSEGARVRLYLGDVVRARLAAQKRETPAFLSEVVIFIPGEAERIVVQRPLRALVFQSMQGTSSMGDSSDTAYFSLRNELAPAGYGRLAIDLRPLAKMGWQSAGFKNGIVTLRPNDPMQYCGIRPASLRLVALREGRRPALVGNVLRFGQALGGPFLMPLGEGSAIEWTEVDSYLPFALLSVQPQEIKPGDRELEFSGWGLALRVSSADKARIEKEPDGVGEKEPDGVVLSGVGGEVMLLWTRPIKLDSESHLMFRVSQGAEHISDARAEIDLDNGEKVFLGFVVNQATVLGNPKRAGKTVRRMTIRLKMKEAPFRLKLGELTLFHSRLIQPNATIHAPRPGLEFVPLFATEVKAPERALLTTSDNRVYGVLSGGDHPPGTLFWSTSVRQPAGALVALQFDYRMSAPADKPCWLTVTLNEKSRRVTRQLCPGGAQGKLIEPLAQFLNDFPPDEIVHSISWKVQLPAGRREAISFDFQAHLGTVHAPSVVDLLQNHPLFRIGQQSYRPAALIDEALKDLVQRGSAWLDLGSFDWEGGGLPLQSADSRLYFRLARVNLESSAAPTEEQWARLSGKDKHGDSSWPRRLAMFGLLLLVAIWAWLRRDSLRRLWKRGLSWIRAAWPPYRSVLGGFTRWAWRTALRFKLWANRAVGAFMLVPGLWLLGRMKSIPLTRGMLGFALLLSAGALWHELRWRYSSRREKTDSVDWWFGNPARIPAFVLVLTTIAMGWAAWKLGRGEMYGALLPLVAVGYYYLPWLVLAVRWIKTGSGMTWAWAFLTVALYLLGLRYGTSTGENYFFTLGCLAAALTLRAWLICVRVRIEACWPVAAEKIYGGAGTLYFAGALIGLVLTALLMILKLEFLAEQVAIVVYYFLVAGTVLEVLDLRRKSRKEASEAGKTTAKDSAG